ncbi:MAG: hypothetical protein B7Z66_12245 [Chromatiales bacterium 21-64-14]|nr:MAG: hypothetical protein B7Z66_12245 [Chromatiales bacterium 21-64-14]HQU15489.1 hypothetical protein [Gammaproteobacteria bacterium]
MSAQLHEVWTGEQQQSLWSLDEVPPSIEWADEEVEKLRFLVMEDAASTFVDGRAGESAFSEAEAWIEDDIIAPFSFRVCCTQLSVDPDEMRDRFRALAAKHRRSVAEATRNRRKPRLRRIWGPQLFDDGGPNTRRTNDARE